MRPERRAQLRGIGNYDWKTLQGGDGFVVLQDPTDYRIAFSESQDGNIVRVDRVTGETMTIRPQPAPGEPRCAGTGTRRSSSRRTIRR